MFPRVTDEAMMDSYLGSVSYLLSFSVFSSQNEPPPPYYSVAVHTQPPLKPYEEVVYGVGPGLTPPTYPHYIPQYSPPVAVPQVAHSSIRECYPQLSHFPGNTVDAGVPAIQIGTETLQGLLMCDCCVLFCVQPPDVRGGDAVRTIPSVMQGQGESYWCSVFWHWPSGLEVPCLFTQIPGHCHQYTLM